MKVLNWLKEDLAKALSTFGRGFGKGWCKFWRWVGRNWVAILVTVLICFFLLLLFTPA